jgi:DNA repair protein RadD
MIPKLRPYQLDVVNQVHEYMASRQNTMVVLGTGGGKSVIISQIVHDLYMDNKKVLLQVHRKELVSQLSLALCKFDITHNIIAPSNVVRQIVSQHRAEFNKNFYHHSSNVIVASVDTLLSRSHKHVDLLNGVDVIITDEAAHLLKDNKWGRCISLFSKAYLLGFTATPERLDKKGLGLDNDGVFSVMVEGTKVRKLIQDGYLSKYKIVAPKSDFESHLGFVKSNTSDFSNEVIKDAANKSQIVGDVVENYLKFANNTQAIVFAPNIEVGKKMEKKFNDSKIPARFLSSLSTDAERFNYVNDFRDNKINVLLNVDLFDEGFDLKIAEGKKIIETVILARPTMSLSKFLQQVGRGLRPSPNKEFAIIIDHVGNVKRHGLPDNERKWSLDRPSRKKTKSLVRICHACAAAYDRIETVCPYCGAEATIKRGDGGGRTPPSEVDGDLFLIDPDTIREMEAATILETPEHIANRVGAVAGVIAGKSAAKKQLERIKVQNELREVIAHWAGVEKSNGLKDREIHKKFFIENNMTISQSLAQPALQMKNLIEDLK